MNVEVKNQNRLVKEVQRKLKEDYGVTSQNKHSLILKAVLKRLPVGLRDQLRHRKWDAFREFVGERIHDQIMSWKPTPRVPDLPPPLRTYSPEFLASEQFLRTWEWRQIRALALQHYGARCMCCGATPAHGERICVDHIKPRKTHPHLALEFGNLQILCEPCNHGKGNWSTTDWRSGQPVDSTEGENA